MTSVPSGAQACLDQSTCSITPTTFSVTPISYHIVTFYKDGYQTFTTQPVYASSANITTTLLVNLALKPSPSLTGTLDIDSQPSDAAIWLDNLYYGTSPVMIGSLSAGAHTLVLRKAGYYDYTESLMIVAGQTTSKNPTLSPYSKGAGYGDIQIQSFPVGAAVYVSNNYMGTTISSSPLYVTQLSPGSYPVRLTLANYQPYTITAVITEGGVYDIRANLVPVSPGPTPLTNGHITIRSNPSGAEVFLDNAYRGLTPLTLVDVPNGGHTILLQMNGYQNWQSSVNVAAGSSHGCYGNARRKPPDNPANPARPDHLEVTQPAPVQTRSPLSVISIISAIGICAAVVLLSKKKE